MLSPGLVKLTIGLTFPVGLIMARACRTCAATPVTTPFVQIVFTGAELFTGNTMYCTAAMLAGKITWKGLVKSWVRARLRR